MDSMNRMIESVMEASAEHGLLAPGDRIVVAVSGGPDSVALLHVLQHISERRVPLKLICAHVNHGFRPESKEEAELVRSLADGLGLPFELAELDIPGYMKASGKGPQEAAREQRYRFLMETAAKYGARKIALAHHADDQAETVLMRLLRGSGTSGLAGMRWKRAEKNVELIRPFLRINKTALLQLCRDMMLPFAEDPSNGQTKYTRNAIRLELMPELERYNGRLTQALTQLAEVAADESDYLDNEAYRAYKELVRGERGNSILERPSFLSLPSALQRRLIKLILNYLSADPSVVDFHKVESVRRGILASQPSSWRLDLGGGLTCIRQYDILQFSSKPPKRLEGYTYELSCPETRLELSEIGKVLTINRMDRRDFRANPEPPGRQTAWFDERQLVFPLTVRSRLPGDTMRVMGLNGSKKVKDIFIDDKIPPSERPRTPMVCDGLGNIVWIPGVRRSQHAPVTAVTSSVLLLTLE